MRAARMPRSSFDGDDCVGWCQFGSPDELPRIKHRRAYVVAGLEREPDWRITCFFVDKATGASGVAAAALAGALERSPGSAAGPSRATRRTPPRRKPSGSFLYNGTVAMFERHGFERTRRLGKHHWVVTKVVA